MAGMKTISEQVYQTIYDGIISGQIKGGEKLTLKSINRCPFTELPTESPA